MSFKLKNTISKILASKRIEDKVLLGYKKNCKVADLQCILNYQLSEMSWKDVIHEKNVYG